MHMHYARAPGRGRRGGVDHHQAGAARRRRVASTDMHAPPKYRDHWRPAVMAAKKALCVIVGAATAAAQGCTDGSQLEQTLSVIE
eukprot:SAG31_NODE_4470_length_3205_cov_70.394915_6_plen_84_part_01